MDPRKIIIKELQKRGWTQRELCRRADLFPHQLCEYLGGHRDLYVETLQRILKVLDLEIRPAIRRRKGQ